MFETFCFFIFSFFSLTCPSAKPEKGMQHHVIDGDSVIFFLVGEGWCCLVGLVNSLASDCTYDSNKGKWNCKK